MDLRGKILSAPWIWVNGKFRQNIRLHIDHNGKIGQISSAPTECGADDNEHMQQQHQPDDGANGVCAAPTTTTGEECCQLENVALLPGFVNAHSHAFHRCLRGRSQIGGRGTNNFWKWRQDMYTIVRNIDFTRIKQICVGTFREMLSAGISTVGEFHYVHHADDQQQQQQQQFGLDLAVVEAALEVGIRLVLIETLYMRSGFTSDGLEADQWRFGSKSVDHFCENVHKLMDTIKHSDNVSLALAVHSLRAVSVPAARQLTQFAVDHHLPLHIHLEEQPAELDQCVMVDAQGREPSQVLLQDILPPAPNSLHFLTVVHCTYTQRHSLNVLFFEFALRGAHICVCPCTEGFLGDGVPDLAEMDQLCVGTDCNNRIAILEELRWLVFCQNMRKNCRNWAALDATKMIEIATKNGASALGLANLVGEFRVGQWTDCLAIDCHSNRLAPFIDCPPGTIRTSDQSDQQNDQQLTDAIVFGAGNAEISLTIVGGKIVYKKNTTTH